ncbi:MAG TPA: M12 family metallopeptidase [Luteitalea sp.]|nr:M12 family metallopeptidase [Luteitalea sp.]
MIARLVSTIALALTAAFATTATAQIPTSENVVVIGDIRVVQSQVADQASRPAGAIDFVDFRGAPWPGGVLPVVFDGSVSDERRRVWLEACRQWEADTPVRCVESASDTRSRFVVSTDVSPSCSSSVGAYRGGGGSMQLNDSCWDRSSVTHLIGHAFGLMDEHQRADRDRYVVIQYENVLRGWLSAFDRMSDARPVGAYHFDSIMHVAPVTYSSNGEPTVVPRPEHAQHLQTMGRGLVPSAGDRAALRLLYGGTLFTPRRVFFDTHELHRVMLRLDALYTSELRRPLGLSLNGEPDFSGLSTWIFHVYLPARVAGLSENDAFARVGALITHSAEWRAIHPGRAPLPVANVFTTFQPDQGEFMATMYRLSEFYRAELKRPQGLVIDGRPDFSGVATWIVHVYLNARLEGVGVEEAWQQVVSLIRDSDEWHSSHP